MQESGKHIIIVGAGLSGLTAAREVLKGAPETRVTVLEANDYVGGRTKTILLHNCNFDLGGQFIGPSQKHVIQLAEESQNQLIPINDHGTKIVDLKEGNFTYNGDIPRIGSLLALVEMQITISKINRMSAKVSPSNPRGCPLGYQWDSITLQAWLDRNIYSLKTKVMLEGAIRVILGAELTEVSLLYFLLYVRQSRDFQNLITVKNGLQESKTSKGTQHMSQFLAEQIQQKGARLRLNFFVKSVQQQGNQVTVTSADGEVLRGDLLVMAMPPPNLSKIVFQPALSTARQLLSQRSFMGSLAKVLVLYPRAYWKEKGFSAEVISDCHDSPAMNVFDNTHLNKEGKQQPCLIVFIGGALYRHWKQDPNFQTRLVQKLSHLFQQPQMLEPLAVHWHPWEEQTVMGGPVFNCPPGLLSQIEDLRKPEGRIHWAGTEMATESIGYMDGAISSGKRVAKEVIERLRTKEDSVTAEWGPDELAYTKWNRPTGIPLMSRIFEWW